MNPKCKKVEQITAFLENRPGILADLCAHLCDRGINIRAMSTLENSEAGSVRMVVDQPHLAKQVLTEAGVAHATASCLAVELPNSPGGFGRIARTLSLAGININYIYATSLPGSSAALGIFAVSDLDRALGLDWVG